MLFYLGQIMAYNDESNPDPNQKYLYLEMYSLYEGKPNEKCVFLIIDG